MAITLTWYMLVLTPCLITCLSWPLSFERILSICCAGFLPRYETLFCPCACLLCLCSSHCLLHLNYRAPRGMGFHPEARNNLIWTFGYLMSNKRYSFGIIGFHHENNYKWCFDYPRLMQDSPLGYWFSPEDNYIWVSVFEVDTRFSFGLLAFTPKKLYMGLRLSGCLSLMQDSPSGHWFSPRK